MGSVTIKGLSYTISELRKFGEKAEKLINAETQSTAFNIEEDAKKRAPKNFGKLAQSISTSQPISDKNKSIISRVITVNELYGAYMEFGTGKKFKPHPDPEWNNIAKSFKGKKPGTFEQGLEAIKVWCKSKGIPEEDAKWIFLKILGAGINPRPFLYPAYIKGKKDYQNNLEGLLKSLNKKI